MTEFGYHEPSGENGYMGEEIVTDHPYKDYTPQDWAVHYIGYYGQCDGGHHKQWTMDQVVRILKGMPITVSLAKWANGTQNYRFHEGEPTQEYYYWVQEMKGEYDEDNDEYEYGYDEGIAS